MQPVLIRESFSTNACPSRHRGLAVGVLGDQFLRLHPDVAEEFGVFRELAMIDTDFSFSGVIASNIGIYPSTRVAPALLSAVSRRPALCIGKNSFPGGWAPTHREPTWLQVGSL